MTTMALFLSAVDVWLFRDGRPFDAGDNHYARSLFPPYPLTMQGAVRAYHLLVKAVNPGDRDAIVATVGTAEDFGSLRMRGPFIARHNADGTLTRYFLTPADVAPWNGNNEVKAITPQAAAERNVITSADERLPLAFFSHSDVQTKKGESGDWLTEAQLEACLQGKPVKPSQADDLFTLEYRYGIGMDSDRRATRQGLLYAAEFIRPCDDVGLYVEVSGYDGWPAQGVLRLGGESRGARFEQVRVLSWPAPPNPLPRRFKLYFASPTYFEGGWKPKDGWKRFFDGDVTLQAAAIRNYEVRGGYDLVSNSQKAARRFVPAGSVYYFEAKDAACLRPNLIQGAITDYGAEIGFGQVRISAW